MMAVALLLATPAQAQFSWGIKGGVNLGSNDLTVLKSKDALLSVDNYTGFFIGPKAEIRIPIIGIGAGGGVDGQVLVVTDMLGMTNGFSPRFLRRYADHLYAGDGRNS